jgi:hypothetical protein
MRQKRSQWLTISTLLALAMAVFLWPASLPTGGQTGANWRVWMKVSSCSTSRSDWVSVADRDPTTGGGGSHFIQFPGSHGWPTFAKAMAEANTLRVAPCTFGTGETPICPKYANYCCANYRVFRNSATRKLTVVVGLYGDPGGGFTEQEGGPMCCEDAAAMAGYPTSFCGGHGGGRLNMENNVDLHGQDYRNFDLTRPSPELCRDACGSDPNCKAYTYVKPGVQGPNARCWLKSSVPPATPSSCCVSGFKGGDSGSSRSGDSSDRGRGGFGGVGRTTNPSSGNLRERPCTADEAAAFSQMTGSWKAGGPKITISGSCEQASGTTDWAEYCGDPDSTSYAKYRGTFTGRMEGGSLQVNWDLPAQSIHQAFKGTASCELKSDGTLSCSGFRCEVGGRKQ